ncbi:MAG TPA: sulfatase-like hydrolase/transferase, partial [Thermoanaerobaculia bacterium]|nr:sulfatase-like hydrolase/transferase [Thermoanaerobaculia bacterium]
RLPGITLLYYFNEAGHLASSAGAHAPLLTVALEVVVTAMLLIAGAEWLRRSHTGAMLRRTRTAGAITLVSIILMMLFYLVPSIVPRAYLWGSRVPILWAMQTWSLRNQARSTSGPVDLTMIHEYQEALGHRIPLGGGDDRYPLCGEGPRNPGRKGNGRSAILLVLESVAMEEIGLRQDGRRVMPHLDRIASESLRFTLKAAGSKSVQAMPALFAGIPPQPSQHMLWRTPLNHVEGFPLLLRQSGYRTSYFHGGDLSFEQQRSFLRMAGFEEIHEFETSEDHPYLGWGHPDDVMFVRLQNWIREHRTSRPSRPYFATLFTLSTHDPYVLPPDREPVFDGENASTRFAESLHFLDEQLGTFYQWYLREELPRGTILVITGDHAPHLSGERRLEDDEVERFDVPLLIRGINPGSVVAPEGRRGAHHDIPATILGALDLSPGRCDQGLDLLMPEAQWPSGRVTYAVAGDQLEQFHVWLPEGQVRLDLATRTAEVEPDAGSMSNEEKEELRRRAARFFGIARSLNAYLVESDGFAPPPQVATPARKPLPSVTRPLFVSHRGQSRGELSAERQNRKAAIEQALADGFEAIEIDVNMTRDLKLVVIHDSTVKVAGVERPLLTLTLDELRALPGFADVMTLDEALEAFRGRLFVEIKPQGESLYANTVIALRAAALVRAEPRAAEIVMDSYSPLIAASLAQRCGCQVGLDAPSRQLDSRWVDQAAASGMEWIYVDHRQASPELIRDAHRRGLRVLVFTVNSVDQIERLRGAWPDAIITDRAALAEEFDSAFGS